MLRSLPAAICRCVLLLAHPSLSDLHTISSHGSADVRCFPLALLVVIAMKSDVKHSSCPSEEIGVNLVAATLLAE